MADQKSALSTALSKVNNNGNGTSSGGGLSTALTRRDQKGGLQKIEGPKTANVSKIVSAVEKSSQVSADIMNAMNKGICFVIDATGSRSATWIAAQQTQAEMFNALTDYKDLEIGVVCHRGGYVQELGWFKESASAKKAMAPIGCVGGETRIVSSLSQALSGRGNKMPSSIIMVGDCFEEDFGQLESVLQTLKEKKVKVYAFLEGKGGEMYDQNGYTAYQRAAEVTGGVFKRFGEDLDLGLTDLCVAAAAYDTGGKVAFDKLLSSGHKGAKALLADIQKKQIGPGNGGYKRLGM